MVSRILALLALLLPLGAAGPSTVPTSASGGSPSFLVTSPTDPSVRLLPRAALASADGAVDEVVVDASRPLHAGRPWLGTGAALTDASLDRLSAHPDLLPLLFGDSSSGAGLDWVRLPLSATDMSTSTWAWRVTGHGARPTPPARRAIGFLRSRVLPLEPDLRVVASAWTAPPRFKDGHAWFGGALREDRAAAYAAFLVQQARWLVRHGVPLAALTLGNEPGHTADYPTMAISDAALASLASRVGPRLDRLGVEVWGLDHNWSDVPRLAATGTTGLDAVALHCYGGSPDDASSLPLPWLVTECTGTTDSATGTFDWDSRHLVVDAVSAGSTGLLMWNLALAPGWRGAYGGCATCRGLLTVPAGTSGSTSGEVVREPEWFVLAHLDRVAPPGATAVSTTTSAPLVVTGFRTAGRVGVYGWNSTDRTRTVRVSTADGSTSSMHEVGPHELFSWVARES